ncbi:GNAT family N-acetyltransferase [Staphylococcus simiae]|uniref:GNAT family N-acetyltransferase n=1 Tax=Staphylococcus simiae TaxID=308354 RepID=UPI001A96C9FC|nr:GNAT family N-acetyltransferase [Staphylococcus simiae]MBO1199590.1 GNAT family N-acetyltransferase [Staphylococcus simiae]MBO1201624.1 GNAT family N-acetyltransferase [Staphylococcus simiae]MBO1203744.1 GNAT family N-acetyltransferase [Staphylococcus simiae]MBO1211607.1 GNAT family N-acetyltransferase [Staphylococcus simiae]MBO1229993.1 GNAT family N-acetyltransferase [Staphylococcus simiae]
MYNVRQATEKDAVAIRDVATKAWFNTYLNIYAAQTVNELLEASYNVHHLKKRLQDQLFLVVEENNDIVGFANFIYGEELFLSAHYVRPESQHKGYGTILLNEGLAKFSNQYDVVYLEVDNQNAEGVEYYKQQGFEILRSYQPEMYGEKLDLALMKKQF